MLAQMRYMVLDGIDDNSTTQTAGSADSDAPSIIFDKSRKFNFGFSQNCIQGDKCWHRAYNLIL